MFLLETIKPGEATGPVAEAYSIFPPEIGVIPPLELLSASPGMLAIHTRSPALLHVPSQLERPASGGHPLRVRRQVRPSLLPSLSTAAC